MIHPTALLLPLLMHVCAAQISTVVPLQPLGIPPASPQNVPAANTPFPTLLPPSQPVLPLGSPLGSGPASSANSNIVVNGGCGTASGAVTTQNVKTQGQFNFCGAPVSQTLRDFLKRGDVESTATTLVESTDTNGLAHGLQVPPGEQVSRSPERDNDPDVTAAKGFARAALIDGSPAQIRKYATVFLRSILPEDLHVFDRNTQRLVSYGQCSLSLSSSTAADQHVIVARETTCKQALVKPYEIQQQLIAIFSNSSTMRFVVDADPNLTSRRRSLLCVGCRPVQSYSCANCWPAAICAQTAFWCKPSVG